MIRPCTEADLAEISAVINQAAGAYRGVIAADRWHDPYMPLAELRAEMEAGVDFWGVDEGGRLEAVMGLQNVADVALIRHAYTRPASQHHGLGSALLGHLRALTDRPMLVGTWAAATWAVRFYQARGFELVAPAEKRDLLRRYWTVPDRQIEESVVLADPRWRAQAGPATGG
jgi:GNAT superfamily N-acetyltransferase